MVQPARPFSPPSPVGLLGKGYGPDDDIKAARDAEMDRWLIGELDRWGGYTDPMGGAPPPYDIPWSRVWFYVWRVGAGVAYGAAVWLFCVAVK